MWATACVLPELAEVEPWPLWACWEWGCYGGALPFSSRVCVNNGASMVDRVPSCTHPQLWPGPHSSPFGLLCAANPSRLPTSVFWSPSFSTKPPRIPTDAPLRLGSAARWPGLSVLVFLHSASCKLVAALSSEPLKLPFCPSWSPHWWRGLPGWGNLSSFTAPSQDSFFFFFLLSYPVTWWSFLQLWLYEIFCQSSVDILWELSPM